MRLSHAERESRNKAIYKDFVKGISTTRLTKKYQLTKATIGEVIRDIGKVSLLEIRTGRPELIVKNYQSGLDEKLIAKKLRVTQKYVIEILSQRMSNYKSPRTRRVEKLTERSIKAFIKGNPFEKIAKQNKCSVENVRRLLSLAGQYVKVGRKKSDLEMRERSIASAIKNATPLHLIIERHHVGPETIRKIAVKNDCDRKYSDLLRAMKLQAIQDIASGLSISQIEEKYRLCPWIARMLRTSASKKIAPKK